MIPNIEQFLFYVELSTSCRLYPTSEGLEFDYVVVKIGNDFVYRGERKYNTIYSFFFFIFASQIIIHERE